MAHDALPDRAAPRHGRARHQPSGAAGRLPGTPETTEPAADASVVIDTAEPTVGIASAEPTVAVAPTEPEPEPVTVPAVDRWRRTLAAARLPDTLIGEDGSTDVLDLTHAHPSGLATLMAGRSTRLSSLVREPAAHAASRRRARLIAASAESLAAERGVRSCYLAAGLVTWTDGPAGAPVLLRSCTLHPRGAGQDDYELDLDDTATVNPEVVRRLASGHGIELDPSWLGGLSFGVDGFDPRPVYALLEDVCAAVPGFAIDRRLVVGSFTPGSDALIADLDAARLALEIHPLLGRLANTTPSMEAAAARPLPDPGDPDADRLRRARPFVVLDPEPESDDVPMELDCAQRAAVDAALGGSHVVMEGPPGTGLTHTLAAAVATLVARGRRALIVTPHRGTADAVVRRFTEAGLGDLVLDLHDGIGDRPKILAALGIGLQAASRNAESGAEGSGAASAAGARAAMTEASAAARLRVAAQALGGATGALHARRDPWGVSAYDAMVALADLMASDNPPRTRVRLPMDTCRQLDATRRDSLRADLRQVAELGAFHQTRVDTRWLDAKVATDDEAARALAAARAAREVLPEAAAAMSRLALAAGLEPATVVGSWRPQLDLLLAVRDTLDVLQPAVFEQPIADLIAALDPDGDPGHEQAGWLARRALRRRAMALVRPGTHLPDLHARLHKAAEQRRRWLDLAPGGGWPRVPTGLEAADAAVNRLELALEVLAGVLDGTGTPDLATLEVDRLRQRLADLCADADGLLAQPQRRVRMKRLHDAGLTPLLADLNDRRPEPEDVDGELDLAWWTSVLETIIRNDPHLARHDPAALRGHVETLREAQAQVLQARVAQILAGVSLRATDVVRTRPDQVRWLLAEVHRGHRSSWPMDCLSRAGELVGALRPIWVMSPDAVARNLPPARPGVPMLDVVAVDDASQAGMPECAATLARAQQVIVAGDRRRMPPATGGPSVIEALAELAPSSVPRTARLVPAHPLVSLHRLDRDHRTRDGRLLFPLRSGYPQAWGLTAGAAASSPLRLEHVREGTGVPAPGEQMAVSAAAEVARVVDLVTEHAVRRPGESLLVVTLGARHAERIEEALRFEVADRPELARWLDVHWAGDISEPFLVRPIHRIPGVERDAVIVSIGLARTPHGRVLHRFGVLDGRFGRACLTTALSRARRRTTLVCCFTAEDLDPERLRTDGSRMLRDVLALAADPDARGDHPPLPVTSAADSDQAPDALVRDLRERLEAVGLPVVDGPVCADWPLELALADPDQPGRRLLAIEVDGPGYASCASVGTRDRLRRETLERAGWTYLRVASMDLFCDPGAEVERIRAQWRDLVGAAQATKETLIIVGRPRVRGPFPPVAPGRPVSLYTSAELEDVASWVLTDGVQRSAEELAALVREALHLPRRGMHVEAAVGGAARRVLDGVPAPDPSGGARVPGP